MELANEAGKMLIVKPSAMGDIIHGLAFLNAVKKRFPRMEVHWVVAKGFQGILQGHPMIDGLRIIDKDAWKKPGRLVTTALEIRELRRALRKEKYDVVVDLQGLFRSGFISALTGSPLRVGFVEAREGSAFFYNARVRGGTELHAVDRYLRIASFLGCGDVPVDFPLSHLRDPDAFNPLRDEDYCVIAPSAGSEAKRWPAEYFGELAALLPLRSLVVAGGPDVELARRVEAAAGGKAISIAGKTTLAGLVEVIRGARFLVSSDTGPMHIAAALKVPVFAMFGPTNPLRTGPYGNIHTAVRAEVQCSPCYKRKKCAQWTCMESITVERVLDAILTGMRRD